jgi:Flp pilus assembly protein TadD
MIAFARIVSCIGMALLLGACASAQKTSQAQGRQVRLGVGEQMAARGDWAGALRVADGLTREDPSDQDALLLRAKALRHQDMDAEAEADLRRLIALEPRNPEAHAELAVLCEYAARGSEALKEHQEASRLAPGHPRYLNNLAFALLARGKPKEGIPMLEEALRYEPRSPRLRNNLGFSYAATGDFVRAAEQFRLGGTPAQSRNNLGFAYERAGNLTQAYDAYLEAVQLDPADPRARANLSHTANQLGRTPPPVSVVPVSIVTEIGGS